MINDTVTYIIKKQQVSKENLFTKTRREGSAKKNFGLLSATNQYSWRIRSVRPQVLPISRLLITQIPRFLRKDYENLVELYLGDLCLSIIWRLAEQNSMVCGFCFCSVIVFVGMCPRLNFGESVFCIVALRNVKPCKATSPRKCSWHTMDFIATCFFFDLYQFCEHQAYVNACSNLNYHFPALLSATNKTT